MKISYNWLKQFINIDLPVEEVSVMLTDCGLEVEGFEKFQSVKGGLEGFVIGEVVSKEKHPDADRLSLTKVNIGAENLLDIVCGAPNVAAGQKVVVATVGTIIYSEKGDFEIKKSKIRGYASEGMICAEDEMGVGTSHDGIMVLPIDAVVGTRACDYFKIENDTVFEIGLTPNRADAASHIGVARDLTAVLNCKNYHSKIITPLQLPEVESFSIKNKDLKIEVIVEDPEACPRYSGISIKGITVKDSPEWLQNRLKAIGLRPINNIVDITNYILHDLGQPLHAFDADKISGGKVVVKQAVEGTKFVTLDGVERTLTNTNLMICNTEKPMCIAGVFGGMDAGVSATTKNIFVESAYFNPVSVRKTSRFHGLKTDSSFRFERGTDPNITVYALKRAAIMISEIAGGEVSSEIVDVYPSAIEPFAVEVRYSKIANLIGYEIEKDIIKNIISSLGIEIKSETEAGLNLLVPTNKVDVLRDVDIVEEILRIYGYNNIPLPQNVNASLSFSVKPNPELLKEKVSALLTGIGFNEIMCNSLTASSYYENLTSFDPQNHVRIVNPLSKDLDVMRRTLLFGGLESIAYNQNRKNPDLKFYEFGKTYVLSNLEGKEVTQRYSESGEIALFITGREESEAWNNSAQKVDFYYIRNIVENILISLGVKDFQLDTQNPETELFSFGLSIKNNTKVVAKIGSVSPALLKKFDVKQEVFYASINWDLLVKTSAKAKVQYAELPKYPEVRRDLALLIDKAVDFATIENMARKQERNLLREVALFDVYEGEKLPEGKKSYAVSFIFRDDEKTLTDDRVEKMMSKLINSYQNDLGAQLR